MSLWLSEVRAGVRLARLRAAVRWTRGVWCELAHDHAWDYFFIGEILHRHCPICDELRDD